METLIQAYLYEAYRSRDLGNPDARNWRAESLQKKYFKDSKEVPAEESNIYAEAYEILADPIRTREYIHCVPSRGFRFPRPRIEEYHDRFKSLTCIDQPIPQRSPLSWSVNPASPHECNIFRCKAFGWVFDIMISGKWNICDQPKISLPHRDENTFEVVFNFSTNKAYKGSLTAPEVRIDMKEVSLGGTRR
jgi:hypothetical protein